MDVFREICAILSLFNGVKDRGLACFAVFKCEDKCCKCWCFWRNGSHRCCVWGIVLLSGRGEGAGGECIQAIVCVSSMGDNGRKDVSPSFVYVELAAMMARVMAWSIHDEWPRCCWCLFHQCHNGAENYLPAVLPCRYGKEGVSQSRYGS